MENNIDKLNRSTPSTTTGSISSLLKKLGLVIITAVSYMTGKYLGILGVILFIVPAIVGYKFPDWYLSRSKVNPNLLKWIAWSNLITPWIFPTLGLLTAACTLRTAKHYTEEKMKYLIFGIIGVLFTISNAYLGSIYHQTPPSASESDSTVISEKLDLTKQSNITQAVVLIFCDSRSKASTYTGSGVIVLERGIILTNSHVIPRSKNSLDVGEKGCLISLPNSHTGEPDKIYWAEPLLIDDINEKYDLAFMKIYATATLPGGNSEEFGILQTIPNKFPWIDISEGCRISDIRLGERIRIYGYPTISGGYSLTITEGIVSSFPGDKLITTSAKVSKGNSGGLAVSESGCAIGIPTSVNADQYESLGQILSLDIVDDFTQELMDADDEM